MEARGLRKVFEDGFVAVDDATFRVDAGEVVALLGPNGAGKTTTMHMLLGLLRPTRGEALVGGHDVVREPERAYREVGYLSENVLLYGNLTAHANLRFFANVSGHTVPEHHLQELLRRVGLHHVQERRVRAFSKGMRQRLGLAVALVKDPGALVLDEPTTGLDPEGTDALLGLVREMREEGRAVLLSTHDLDRVPEIADRVVVIAGGRVRATLGRDEVAAEGIRPLYRRHAGGGP